METKIFPGCMSAWKKPSRNTCVKKISTPARASARMSMPASLHPRAQHLDRNLAPVVEDGEMDLRDGRARDGFLVEGKEHFRNFLSKRFFNLENCQARGERRHLVLQLGKLVGDVERQQVAARGEHLAELDEDRAERLERLAQALGAPRRALAQVVQPEAQADPEDARQAQQVTQGGGSAVRGARARRAGWRCRAR